jgi:hypothetical protein
MGNTGVVEGGVVDPSVQAELCRRLQTILRHYGLEMADNVAAKLKERERVHFQLMPVVSCQGVPIVLKGLHGEERPGLVLVLKSVLATVTRSVKIDSDRVRAVFTEVFHPKRHEIHNKFVLCPQSMFESWRLVPGQVEIMAVKVDKQVNFEVDLFRLLVPSDSSIHRVDLLKIGV